PALLEENQIQGVIQPPGWLMIAPRSRRRSFWRVALATAPDWISLEATSKSRVPPPVAQRAGLPQIGARRAASPARRLPPNRCSARSAPARRRGRQLTAAYPAPGLQRARASRGRFARP